MRTQHSSAARTRGVDMPGLWVSGAGCGMAGCRHRVYLLIWMKRLTSRRGAGTMPAIRRDRRRGRPFDAGAAPFRNRHAEPGGEGAKSCGDLCVHRKMVVAAAPVDGMCTDFLTTPQASMIPFPAGGGSPMSLFVPAAAYPNSPSATRAEGD